MKKLQLWKSKDPSEKEALSRKGTVFAVILSVFLALILWFSVQDVQTADYTHTFDNVAVKIQSAQGGLSVIRGGGAFTCNVTLKGKRSTINKLKAADLEAVADLSTITAAGDYEVEISVLAPEGTEVSEVFPKKASVKLDETIVREVPVRLILGEYEAGENTVIVSDLPENETVTIKGAKEYAEKVSYAELSTGDLGKVTTDKQRNLEYKLCGEDGSEIDESYLSFEGENTRLVSLTLVKTKTVDVEVQTVHGYFKDDEISVSPKVISVKGSPALVDALNSLTLVTLDETKIDGSVYENTFSLTEKDLPKGLEFANGGAEITVSVKLRDNVARTLQVNLNAASRVTILKDEGVSVSFEENLVNFRVRGSAETVGDASLDDFQFVIDLRDVTSPGEQQAVLQIIPVGEDKGFYPVGEVKVTALIRVEG